MATALEVANAYCDEVGFTRPGTLVGNTQDDARQILALLNACGRDLASRNNWQAMTYEATFTTVATESQGTLASIIGATQVLKCILNETIWDRTTRIPFYGPLSPKVWQAYKALTMVGPFPQYRVRENEILMNPVPPAGDDGFFEYVSKCWCTDAAGTTFRVKIAADTDVFLVDSDLIVAGLKWMWLSAKRLAYAEEFNTYERLVAQAVTDEKPRQTLSMDQHIQGPRPGVFIPIGSWNLP